MRQNWTRLVAVVLCSSLVGSCSMPISGPRMSARPMATSTTKAGRPANEVRLTRKDHAPVLGKLVGIEGEDVTFLPAPYWNVPTQLVPLDDILTIEVTDVRRGAGWAGALSFATGFVVTGGICGAAAEYDEDYRACLAGAAVIGGVVGLIGLGVGALRGRTKTYHIDRMTPPKRREAVQRLVAR